MHELGTHHADFTPELTGPQQQYSVAERMRADAELLSVGISKENTVTGSNASLGNRLSAEAKLLGSVPFNIGNGIAKSAQDAWDNKWRSGIEFGAGLVLGSAFTLLSRNPNAAVRFTTTWMTRGFIGATALDLGSRVALPMAKVWNRPETLELQKVQLGNDLGDAALNYGLGIAGGLAGAKMTEKYVAPTKLGTWLQGFKETTVNSQELGAMVAKPAAADSGVDGLKSSFAGKSPDDLLPKIDLPTGKVKLRELADGSKIGSLSDGSVLVLTNDGTAMFFKNNSTMFGLKRNLELQRVVNPNGMQADLSVSSLQTASRPAGFAGRDPSVYLDGPTPGTGSAAESFQLSSGPRVSMDARGTIKSLQTESGNVVQSAKGDWQYKPSGTNGSAELDLKIPTFSLKTTTDWLLGYKKSAQVGVFSRLLDTASELGSGIVQHEIIQKIPGKSTDRLNDNTRLPGS